MWFMEIRHARFPQENLAVIFFNTPLGTHSLNYSEQCIPKAHLRQWHTGVEEVARTVYNFFFFWPISHFCWAWPHFHTKKCLSHGYRDFCVTNQINSSIFVSWTLGAPVQPKLCLQCLCIKVRKFQMCATRKVSAWKGLHDYNVITHMHRVAQTLPALQENKAGFGLSNPTSLVGRGTYAIMSSFNQVF